MTDAREIIAQHLCDRSGQGWSGISAFERAAYRTAAHGMIEAINTAGFRIIGKDEVDLVTVEKCAEVAECHSDERSRRYSMDWNDGYIDGCRGAAAAIRAIGRKA